ncbi:unnamed protein product, partial [marine sediment metagenome]
DVDANQIPSGCFALSGSRREVSCIEPYDLLC